jgi:hypothetical protein
MSAAGARHSDDEARQRHEELAQQMTPGDYQRMLGQLLGGGGGGQAGKGALAGIVANAARRLLG